MSDRDLLLQTIDAIYASGIERDRWPQALEGTVRLLGAAGAFFGAGKIPEVIDTAAEQPSEFWSFGTPEFGSARNAKQVVSLNPRVPFTHSKGQLVWDYQFIDEDKMARHPFYAEFLSSLGLRYCLAAVLERTPSKLVTVSIQRTPKQGHVNEREISLMRSLFPHFQRTYDISLRLKTTGSRQEGLENAFDWMNDGVALLRADARIIYANEALGMYASRCDAFRIVDSNIEFVSPEARIRFGAAFNAVQKIRENALTNPCSTDFSVTRCDGMPAYTVALRPLMRSQAHTLRHVDAAAMLLIHDPLARNVAVSQMLQELFGLTNAEANLGQALCAGMTTTAYASTRRVSLNTVYTHLRKLREKTDCQSVAELVRKFGELNVPLKRNAAERPNQIQNKGS